MTTKREPEYPSWAYYPQSALPPPWVHDFSEAVNAVRASIDSRTVDNLNSDRVLAHLAPGLKALGFQIEASKKVKDRIRRPVLFGENGRERVAYEVDAVHDDLGIVVEVEAARGARGNAIFRDLIRTSLIVGARYLIIGTMLQYRHKSAGKVARVSAYEEAKQQLDAVYASGRLALPFDGILLFGY